MAPPTRVEEHVARYFQARKGVTPHPHLAPAAPVIPEFFQRKRMEEELRRSHEQLEQRVAERTEEVVRANQQLREEIAGRTEAQAALQRANERFEVASTAADTVIYETDLGEQRITWTRGLSEIFGYPLNEIPPSRTWWKSCIHPDDLARTETELAESLKDKPDFFLEYRFRARNGRYMQIWDKGRIVRDESGRPRRLIGAIVPISERKRLEDELRQAQNMEAIGRLAGGVAHDFNNVLTAVFGYVDLLREELPQDSDAQKDLSEVRKAAERAASLTRQLLAFSRQQVLEPVVLELNELVTDFEKMLRRVIGEDVELRLALGADVGNVRADPGQLHQVIMNLVVNARDAMPTGGKLILETANAELTSG